MFKKLFLFSLIALHGYTTCMEVELYSPFSEIPQEITDSIVYQNNIADIHSFSKTNTNYYEQYNADKTLLENKNICAALSPKQHTLRLIKSAQMNDAVMAQWIIDTENQQNKHIRQEIFQIFKYQTVVHYAMDCLSCFMKAYKGIISNKNTLNDPYLLLSVFHKNPLAVLILIKNNIPINTTSKYGQTPLILATLINNKSIVEMLLTYNCLQNIQDITGYTALHHACLSKETENIAQLLLKSGASLNIQSERGDTPLHIAIRKKNLFLAQQLIAKGADITIKNNQNKLALELTGKKNQKTLKSHIPTNKRKKTDTIVFAQEPAYKKSKK